MDKVIDGLYISDYMTACKREILKQHNITHIIIAAKYLKAMYPIEIDYLQLPIDDFPTENIATYFEHCIEFIEKARREGGAVLVHCAAGVSRSSTIVLAYLMFIQQLGLNECLVQLKKCRPCVWPNEGFYKQLGVFENRLGLKSLINKPSYFSFFEGDDNFA